MNTEQTQDISFDTWSHLQHYNIHKLWTASACWQEWSKPKPFCQNLLLQRLPLAADFESWPLITLLLLIFGCHFCFQLQWSISFSMKFLLFFHLVILEQTKKFKIIGTQYHNLNTGWFSWLVRPKKWLSVRLQSLQKSSKCQNFLRVWHLVIFRADQSKKPPCISLLYPGTGNY